MNCNVIIFLLLSAILGVFIWFNFRSYNTFNDIWRPSVSDKFQWQFVGETNLEVSADVFVLDLFDTDIETINKLHSLGKGVVCYINVGAWENWRQDASSFDKEIIGKDYIGWPGEKWLDIKRFDLFSKIIKNRFDLCQQKGFDGIEPDNINTHSIGVEETGFDISFDEQLKFNRWLANEAHIRGLSIGLKNNSDQSIELLKDFDWAISESCFEQGWCDDFKKFIDNGKAVAMIEYSDPNVSFGAICKYALINKFSVSFKKYNLDEWVKYCDK